MILVIFGLPGAGKSYLGNVLQKKFGFFHYDGDDALPVNMKNKLLRGQQVTDRQRSIFFNRLLKQIKKISKQHKHITVSQTFIKEQYRFRFAKHFPSALFLLVHTTTLIREKRLARRKKFPLNKECHRTMSLMFEPPRIAHLIINNYTPGKKMIVSQLQAILPSLKDMVAY